MFGSKTKILSIDPSSKLTGYAVLTAAGDVLEHGLFRPKAKESANDRIIAMSRDMREAIGEFAPDVVLIEDTTGKVGRGRHNGGGAGLSIYGKAIGYMLAEARSCRGVTVVTVLENEWTRGRAKSVRQSDIANKVRSYDREKDKGGDAADAIGLALWWIEKNCVRFPLAS